MLTESPPRTPLALERGTFAVCIPVYGAYDAFVECLHSILRHTPPDVPIVVGDDASPDPAIRGLLDRLEAEGANEHRIHYVRQERNVGFVRNCNDLFEAVAPADVILVNSDCVVGPEWAARLRAAAYDDSTIATATALTNHGTILSLPRRNEPGRLPPGKSLEEIVRSLQHVSRQIRPRIPTAIGHCFYIRRSALDLVGPFDPAFSPGYGEEVDFSQRCLLRGLVHVVADDVFVYHRGNASFGKSPQQERNEQVLRARYPYYPGAVEAASQDVAGPLPRALSLGRIAMRGLRVTVDARSLGPVLTGTQIHTLELIVALARTGRVRLRAVVPGDIGSTASATLAALDDVQVVELGSPGVHIEPDDVVHRPYQLLDELDFNLLPSLGERLVITHQDMISYRNPGYFSSPEMWRRFRALTREAFARADHVCFFSRHASEDAEAEQLIEPSRTSVVYLGTDHHTLSLVPSPKPPAAARGDAFGPFLLCIGTDFRHKNRVFALQVFTELQQRHGWEGSLVFAGPQVSEGSSRSNEAEFLALHPKVEDRVVDLRNVSEAEKSWLFENCAGVLYPSAYEGFGLVPFEAARYGAPCFFAWQTALAETLPESSATIVPWDAAATADSIFAVLGDERRGQELIEAVQAAAARFTWDSTAEQLAGLYEHVVGTPRRDVSAISSDADELVNRTGETELLPLPTDVANAMLAFMLRPWLREPLFWSLRATFRVGHVARRLRGASQA